MPDALAPVTLRAPGLLLRPWSPADAPAVTEACQDPEVQRWTRVPSPYLPEHGAGFVGADGERWAAGLPTFAVVDAETGRLLGSHGLVARPAPGVVEVGYWVAAHARGRGVATAATRAVARWALTDLGAHRVEWHAEVGNTGSRRVAERCGFTVEGVLRERLETPLGWRDVWVAGLLRRDLPAQDPPAPSPPGAHPPAA